MRSTNRSLMCSQQPSFQQRSRSVRQGQQVLPDIRGFPDHGVVISQRGQLPISTPTIRAHHTAWLHRVLYSLGETICRSVGNTIQANSPDMPCIFLCRHHHQSLSRSPATTLARLFAANVSFVYLNSTGQAVTARPHHGYPQLLQPCPGGFIPWQSQNPLEPQSADTVLLAGHMPDGPKPQPQGFSGVLKDRARGDRGLIIAMTTAIKTPLGRPCLPMATSRTTKPFRPPQLKQIPAAGLIGSKPLFKFQDGFGVIFNFHQPLYYI